MAASTDSTVSRVNDARRAERGDAMLTVRATDDAVGAARLMVLAVDAGVVVDAEDGVVDVCVDGCDCAGREAAEDEAAAVLASMLVSSWIGSRCG